MPIKMPIRQQRSLCLLDRVILDVSVAFIFYTVRMAVRLPDRALEYIFRAYKALAYPFVAHPEDLYQCDEMIKVFSELPEYAQAVRRIVLEARPEQFKAAIRGMVLHHVIGV